MSLKASPRSQQPLNSLATKLILFVFVSTFATALVVSGISIQSTHTYLSQQIGQQYPAAVEKAGEGLLEWLVGGQEELGGLARDGDLQRVPSRDTAGGSPLAAALASAQRRSKHFDAFVLIAGDSHVRDVVGENARFTPGRPLSLAGIDRTVLRVLNSDGERLLVAATPFPVDASGAGALVGVFKVARIPALLAQQRPESGAEMRIVD
jgi:hypothetical protein